MKFFHFLRKSDQGNAAIEFAVILPILLLIMAAVIEFGWYFLRADADNRALATASTAIMVSPSSTSQAVANTYGTALVSFGRDGNYICAQAYQQQANASAYCTSGTWNVTTCADTGAPCTNPYYVAVKAYAASKSLTGLASMVSLSATTVTQQNIVTVGASGGGAGGAGAAWVNVPTGPGMLGGGRANMSPSQWCQQQGYHAPTGGCILPVSGSSGDPGAGGSYAEGSLSAVGGGQMNGAGGSSAWNWKWLCSISPAFVNADGNPYGMGVLGPNTYGPPSQINCN